MMIIVAIRLSLRNKSLFFSIHVQIKFLHLNFAGRLKYPRNSNLKTKMSFEVILLFSLSNYFAELIISIHQVVILLSELIYPFIFSKLLSLSFASYALFFIVKEIVLHNVFRILLNSSLTHVYIIAHFVKWRYCY